MDEKTSKILEQFVANPTLEKMKNVSNNPYGVTQEYNSQNRNTLWDSVQKKNDYKESVFNGNKTYHDPISDQDLHYSQKAAQKKFHMKNSAGENSSTAWAKHSAEVDHIVPIKEIHNRVKGNPFLSDTDVNDIINHRFNYRIISKDYNASKGRKSDLRLSRDKSKEITPKGQRKLISEKINAEVYLTAAFTARTVQNIGTEFIEGAVFSLEASAVPLLVEGVNNLYKVAIGEKEFGEAAKDMGKLTLSVAASGGTIRVVSTGVTNLMKNSKSEVLKKIANSNQVTEIVTITIIVSDSIFKYLNGEINGQQFFEEIGEKGVSMMSGTIGAIIGQTLIPIPIIGAAIGSMIVSSVCVDLYKTAISINDYKEIEKKVSQLANDAWAEMNRQQEVLKLLVKEEFSEWDKQFNKGYGMIVNGTLENSSENINLGLSCVLSVFSKNVAFKNQNEFDNMFFDNNSVFNM